MPKQGARNDIEVCAKMICEGIDLSTVANEHPVAYIKFHKGFTALASARIPKRNFKTEVFWYYGPTGTGKSHSARAEAGDDVFYKMGGNRWWDGYVGQSDVIIDDFRKDLCPFHELLRLFDKYPHRIEYKGGSCEFVAKRIWVTCHKSPSELFVDATTGVEREDLGQLLRRLTVVRRFSEFFGGARGISSGNDCVGDAPPSSFAESFVL